MVRLAETGLGRRAHTLTNVATPHVRRPMKRAAPLCRQSERLVPRQTKVEGSRLQSLRWTKAPALIERIVFDIDICKGPSETVPATGSRRKSRDHLRPRSGRILPPCDIGSSSTRLRLGFLRRTRAHRHKPGWTRFHTTMPLQERRYQTSVSQGFSSRRPSWFSTVLKSTPQRKNKSPLFDRIIEVVQN